MTASSIQPRFSVLFSLGKLSRKFYMTYFDVENYQLGWTSSSLLRISEVITFFYYCVEFLEFEQPVLKIGTDGEEKINFETLYTKLVLSKV